MAAGYCVQNITLADGVQLLGAGAEVTTIDGGGVGSVVIAIGVGPGTSIEGFTLTNGSGWPEGGDIRVQDANHDSEGQCHIRESSRPH